MSTPTVYLLSVGINNYESSCIDNLAGCVKDARKFREIVIDLGLTKKQNCISLFDSQATRARIIETIKSHFSQMVDGDIAVFHFSGHGIHEYSHPVFIEQGLEVPSGKIESFVPSDHSNEVYPIADKEIRWLVHEIQSAKPNTQFISIFDCCHSGSMMRNDTARNIKQITRSYSIRPLDSFFDGQYHSMLDNTGTIKLPIINYISFTACSSKEEASEYANGSGGFFTNAIVELLKAENVNLTYAQIHSIVCNKVKRISNNKQTPNLESAGNANPHQYFLTAKSIIHNMPILRKIGDSWQTNVGLLNGLTQINRVTTNLSIYHKKDMETPIGFAKIVEIKKEKTMVTPMWTNSLNPPNESELLFIGLGINQIPLAIKDSDNMPMHQNINEVFDIGVSQGHFFLSNDANYEIKFSENKIQIYKKETNMRELIIGLKENSDEAREWLRYQMGIIAKWETLKNITTPKHSKISFESIRLHISLSRIHAEKKPFSLASYINHLSPLEQFSIPNFSAEDQVLYKIDVENEHSVGIYFMLIHLDRFYNIFNKYEDYGKSIPKNGQIALFDSFNHGVALDIKDSNVDTCDDQFLLFASETPFGSPHQLEQIGFGDNLGKMVELSNPAQLKGDSSEEMPADWIVKKIVVRLEKKGAS